MFASHHSLLVCLDKGRGLFHFPASGAGAFPPSRGRRKCHLSQRFGEWHRTASGTEFHATSDGPIRADLSRNHRRPDTLPDRESRDLREQLNGTKW
jgi:hypothetical protein